MMNRRGITLFTALLLLSTAPAQAQMNYYNADAAKKPVTAPKPAPAMDDAAATADDDSAGMGDGGGTDDAGSSTAILPMQSATVTSVDACLSQLDPAEAAEIRKSYIRPYQECQSRLAAQLSKKKTAKVTAEKKAAEAESPRNYVRVNPSKAAAADDADSDSGTAAAPAATPAAPPAYGSWSSSINPNNSKAKLNN